MQTVMRIEELPEAALDAATAFSADWLDVVRERLSLGEDLVIALPPALYDHSDWRRSAIRDLARAYAPVRVNMIAGQDVATLDAAAAYLSQAPGVTGQFLPLVDGIIDG